MSRDTIRLLLVEDNPGDARLIREMLNDEWGKGSYQIRVAGSVDEAMAAIGESSPNLLLLDLSLPDSFGLDTFRRIQTVLPSAPIIVLTGNQDHALALAAVKEGAQDFLVKNDLTGGLLVKAIQYASERKQIEASLRVNEARFRSLAELSSDWYWEQDPYGKLSYVSEGLKEKSGIDSSRLVGSCWWDIAAMQSGAGWDELRKKMASHASFTDVLVRYSTDGPEPVFLSLSGVPVASDDGAFAGYRGVGKDVSARERIDAALRGSEERYRRIMDSARDGILMFDASGIVTFANLRISTMLGFDEDEICGRELRSFVVHSDRRRGEVPALSDDDSGVELRRKDGSSIWTMQITYPVNAKDGSRAGTLSIFTDITEFKEREEKIRQLAALAAEKSEAERANLAKSRFLAAVSHDLRQPMHALSLFIEDLKNAGLDKKDLLLLDKMEVALDLTNSLLDTILVMSGLESGMVTPNVVVFPLQKILNRVAQAFGTMAQKKGLRLSVIPSTAFVRSDPALLERVIMNLVSNAIRYTDRGGVAVACRRRGGHLNIQVWDTGPGIPDEYREAIFREFFRIEGEGSHRGGLGLGLAIVQSCAVLLGHPLELESRTGRGSRFAIRVPTAEPLDETRQPEELEEDENRNGQPVSFVGVRVLVIDDDDLLLESTAGLLRRWGCEVMVASSGVAAHAILSGSSQPVNLIISDLRLADGETGTKLVAALRVKHDQTLPALIVTGDRSLKTAREIKEHRLPFLYKPLPAGRFKSLMAQLLKTKAGS
jgi:PAS domain S-box-containing protein